MAAAGTEDENTSSRWAESKPPSTSTPTESDQHDGRNDDEKPLAHSSPLRVVLDVSTLPGTTSNPRFLAP